jgi:hypothetical protein
MSARVEILSRFAGGSPGAPFFLPDLTLWYDTHRRRDTLPPRWQGAALPRIARDLGLPVWAVARPWRIETPGVEVRRTEADGQRTVETSTPAGPLTARWSLGSDGSWWQTEYPVKTAAELEIALELARARTYVLEPAGLEAADREIGADGVLAIEIPTRPYADLLYDLVGMSEGYLLLMEGPPAMGEFIGILEEKLQVFVRELAGLPGSLFFSPDNLDGQFIYPPVFAEFLSGSYGRTTQVLRRAGKFLVVHAGGPVGQLLAPLARAGVDGVEGVAPPPQSDTSLTQARGLAGPDLTLWGGIAQDFLPPARDREEFARAVAQAAGQAAGDGRVLLGVADRVPVDAELDRLEAIPSLIDQALGR